MDCDYKGQKYRDGVCPCPAVRFFCSSWTVTFKGVCKARCAAHAKRIEDNKLFVEVDEDTYIVAKIMES